MLRTATIVHLGLYVQPQDAWETNSDVVVVLDVCNALVKHDIIATTTATTTNPTATTAATITATIMYVV